MATWDAVIVDLDGTLLLPDGSLGEYTKDVFKKLKQKGIPVYVATGRPFAGARQATLGLEVAPIMAAYNGTQLVDLNTGQNLRQLFLPGDLASIIATEFECHYFDHIIYHNEIKHMRILKHQQVCLDLAQIFINVEIIDQFDFSVQRKCPRVSCFGHLSELQKMSHWLRDINEIYVEMFPFKAIAQFPHSNMFYLEAQAACDGKRELISYLESECGVKNSKILAFGDQSNDINLLKHAGWGVAVGNAIDQCKEVADQIIGTNGQESVAHYLEETFL